MAYFFALNMNVANVERYGKMIIDSKDSIYNYYFAYDVKGSDVKAHGKVIIESKDSEFNDRFKEDFEYEYKIIKRNNFIDDAYNFIDNALDEMIKENIEENKSMQKRF